MYEYDPNAPAGSFTPSATLTFEGVVKDGSTVVGFFAKNDSTGQYLLFSNDSNLGGLTNLTFDYSGGADSPYAYQFGFYESPSDPGGAMAFCFMAGTSILTPDGNVAVETIKIGDIVSLSDGRTAPVTWLGIQTVSTKFADKLRVLPIRIKAGALGDAMPARDLLISPDHAILLGDILVQAGALVNGVSITRETDVPESFTYYHVEVADHSLIMAENVPAETFVDNVDRMAFDNWAEHQALYGDAPAIAEMDYPRAKAQRQVPLALRNKLSARAEALYGKDIATAA
jgi:hypothetical protein